MKPSEPAERTHRGLSGVLSSAGAGIVALVAGIVLIPIIIATVSAERYGTWLVVSAVAQYLNYADLGVGTAIIHFGSRARAGGEQRTLGEFLQAGLIWNAMALVVVAPAFVWASYLYLWSEKAQATLSHGEASALMIAGVVMLASLILKPYGAALSGAGLLPLDRRNQAIGSLVRVALTLIACLVFRNIVAVAAAEALAVIIPALLSCAAVRRRHLAHSRWQGFPRATLKYMLSYSVRSFAVNAVGALLLQSGTVIAGILLRPQDVTYYNAAFRVYSSVRQLIGWANDPFRPALSRLGVTSRDAATKALMAVSFVTLALSSSGCIALMLAAPDVVKIWLGAAAPKYVAVALTILLAGLIVNAVHLPLVPAADAAGSPGAFFIPQLSWMIMTLAGSVLLGNLLGAPGVALGLTLPLVLVEPYYLLRAGRVLQFSVASWFKLVLLPTALITTGGLLLAGLCAILMLPVQVVHMGFFQAAAFLIGVLLTALTLRKKLPWENFSRLARLDL